MGQIVTIYLSGLAVEYRFSMRRPQLLKFPVTPERAAL